MDPDENTSSSIIGTTQTNTRDDTLIEKLQDEISELRSAQQETSKQVQTLIETKDYKTQRVQKTQITAIYNFMHHTERRIQVLEEWFIKWHHIGWERELLEIRNYVNQIRHMLTLPHPFRRAPPKHSSLLPKAPPGSSNRPRARDSYSPDVSDTFGTVSPFSDDYINEPGADTTDISTSDAPQPQTLMDPSPRPTTVYTVTADPDSSEGSRPAT